MAGLEGVPYKYPICTLRFEGFPLSIRKFMNLMEDGPANALVPYSPAGAPALAHHSIDELPDTFTDALRDAGSGAHVHWRKIGNMTGLYGAGLKQLGKDLFGHFSNTPLNDIRLVTSADHGNSESELQTVCRWVRQNGQRIDNADVTMSNIPGYKASVTIYTALGYEFMLVEDGAGRYCYAYESKRLGGPSAQAPQLAAPMKQIDHQPLPKLAAPEIGPDDWSIEDDDFFKS